MLSRDKSPLVKSPRSDPASGSKINTSLGGKTMSQNFSLMRWDDNWRRQHYIDGPSYYFLDLSTQGPSQFWIFLKNWNCSGPGGGDGCFDFFFKKISVLKNWKKNPMFRTRRWWWLPSRSSTGPRAQPGGTRNQSWEWYCFVCLCLCDWRSRETLPTKR